MQFKAQDPSLSDRWDSAVRMISHQASWPAEAQLEADRLLAALSPWAVVVDHVGSTAVSGMPAKPIIDLQVAVADVSNLLEYQPVFTALGYTWIHDPATLDYVLFVRPRSRPRTHHLHVCEAGGHHERRHLAVRNLLRADASEARAYAKLKRDLVAGSPGDRLAYIAGKDGYMRLLEQRALTRAAA